MIAVPNEIPFLMVFLLSPVAPLRLLCQNKSNAYATMRLELFAAVNGTARETGGSGGIGGLGNG